ncbi:hypothetical protein ACFVWG_24020 [Kribbella sp. NPDC058245]|uniref:hypothetical protein n=1 Tax=Kribbella sp. NPDC058245 TaxID=3346399 RepID=UPI0036E747AF
MRPVAPYADAEAAAVNFLAPLLAGYDPTIQIGVRGAGPRFVRVRRVGGIDTTPNHDRPVLDVLVWHDTDKTRMHLANQLWAWLRAANNDPAGDAVVLYAATVLGPRQMPDPADETKAICLFTVELIVRPA